MHDDPARYWQDLTDNYRRMSDGELLELAQKPEDLTDVAQQVLRDEMKLRKLELRPPSVAASRIINVSRRNYDAFSGPFDGALVVPSEAGPVEEEADGEEGPPPEFTWKTLLCDCESNDHALQLQAALMRHGIESWVRQASAYSTDVLGPQIYVAADQLEHAQAVAAQPIPQDIVDEWNTVIPEFEVPVCPRCGTNHEVVLESTEPLNSWLCEGCGAEWSDSESHGDATPGIAESR